jgi:alpha-tubulin suppressor-like RCC1 family protein
MNRKALFVVIVAVFGFVACQQPAVPQTSAALDRAVSSEKPLRSKSTGGIFRVSTGGHHSCAITTTDGVRCWGLNANGQVGNGSTVNSSIPADVHDLSTGIQAVDAVSLVCTLCC